jgi:RNA polymerase sigma-70 factor (ECF subfamily)
VTDESVRVSELLRQARAGDGDALQRLLERYRPLVVLLVRSRCVGPLRRRLDGSDLVQETWLRAAQHIRDFQGEHEAEWRAWLMRIAEREVIRQARHHLGAQKRAVGREQPLAAAPNSSVHGQSRLDQWLQIHSSPSAAVMRQERSAELAQALDRLPADYREVLILRHLENLSFADVAERMERTAGAVRVLWTRALKKLRQVLMPTAGGSHG